MFLCYSVVTQIYCSDEKMHSLPEEELHQAPRSLWLTVLKTEPMKQLVTVAYQSLVEEGLILKQPCKKKPICFPTITHQHNLD